MQIMLSFSRTILEKKACYNSGVLVQLIAYVGPTSVSDSYSK